MLARGNQDSNVIMLVTMESGKRGKDVLDL